MIAQRATIIGLLLIVLVLPICSSVRTNTFHYGRKVLYRDMVVATAYNSLPGQTDSSPWTTASGTRCRPGVIASNHLPIGTRIMIKGLGNRVFVVEDRMNKRYSKRIDIWFGSYSEARQFGKRQIEYYVLNT